MQFIILTQSGEIVNFTQMQQIYASVAEIPDDNDETRITQVYPVLAVPVGIRTDEDDEKIILGIYDTEEACDRAFQKLYHSLQNGVTNVFEMPPSEEDDAGE